MIVTFCGHSKINTGRDGIRAQLTSVTETLIQEGATLFYSGGYGDFDWMAASVLHGLKGSYPHIQSILVLAYLNREQEWDDERREAWREDLKLFDGTTYPPLERVPKRLAIVRRNAWMVLCEASHNIIYEKQMVMQSNRIKVAYNNLFCADNFTLP